MKPGFFNWTETEYHADPCPSPSLSSSIGKIILGQSPAHAYTAHPRLNPEFEAEEKASFDLGEAVHKHLLTEGRAIEVVDADDWRTKAAKELRDQARAANKIPILKAKMAEVEAMVGAARKQLARFQVPDLLEGGKPEESLAWTEETEYGEIWCRARLDYAKPPEFVIDYKTSGVSAHPDALPRRVYDLGYDFQAAFYRRGIRALTKISPRFVFIFQETSAPYAISPIELSPAALDMAERKVEEAIRLFAWSMNKGSWPGYPNRITRIDPPAWAEKSWLEREARAEVMRDQSPNLPENLLDWQRPL